MNSNLIEYDILCNEKEINGTENEHFLQVPLSNLALLPVSNRDIQVLQPLLLLRLGLITSRCPRMTGSSWKSSR
jgi:hypothetical protein